MLSSELALTLTADDERVLLEVAAASIDAGLSTGRKLNVTAADYSQSLQSLRSSFVTLRIEGDLRGCMGALTAVEPLVADVARNAYSAAFRDPRFEKLTRSEFDALDIHISILDVPEPLEIDSEEDLLQKMRPGIDGLILYEGSQKGTLLPAVWENIADPRRFLAHLKQKAGLAVDYWSNTIRVERYTATSIGH